MEGIQKSVALGLRELADKVEAGDYGIDDEAFGGLEDCEGEKFLRDLTDLAVDKME